MKLSRVSLQGSARSHLLFFLGRYQRRSPMIPVILAQIRSELDATGKNNRARGRNNDDDNYNHNVLRLSYMEILMLSRYLLATFDVDRELVNIEFRKPLYGNRDYLCIDSSSAHHVSWVFFFGNV